MGALAGWVDSRTGLGRLGRGLFGHAIPGGSRWVYVFGSALALVLVMQVVTGGLLALYYVPSVEHAHTTVSYIQKEVTLGWLVRGVHYYGASAVIVLLLLHLARVFVWGAYKERREALWLSGVLLLNVVLVFGVTGYLLPWDQKAYFGTQVAGGIASSVPAVGGYASGLLLGGSGVGQAALSRFYWLHVFALPAALLLLGVAHVALCRFRGAAGAPASGVVEVTERYGARQRALDLLAGVLVIGLVAALAAYRPAVIGPEADPSVSFSPRPEWYFLWLYELLKVLPTFVGGVVVPGVLMTLLALAPWLDRSPSRAVRDRLLPIGVFAAALVGIAGAIGFGLYADARDPAIRAQEEAARRFMSEPFVPADLGAAEPEPQGTAAAGPPPVYRPNCASCHGRQGQGGAGPAFAGVAAKPRRSREDIAALIADPRAYGLKEKMPAFPELSEADRLAIADWIVRLGPAPR